MSTAVRIFADEIADTAATITRKRRQAPYKPRLSNTIKATLEESVNEAIEAQKVMGKILGWTEAERALRDEMRADLDKFAPLDHRVRLLVDLNRSLLLRVGELDHEVAKLALIITAMERELTRALVASRPAIAPPRERTAGNGIGEPS